MKELRDFYFTFGQSHVHKLADTQFDKDCVCHILAESDEEARQIAFETFGSKWSRQFGNLADVGMEFYPRGIISLND